MRVAPLGLHGGEVRELRGVGAHRVLVQIKSLVPLMRRPKRAPGGGASGRGVTAGGVPAMDAFAAALAAVGGGEGREALEVRWQRQRAKSLGVRGEAKNGAVSF